MIIFVTFLCYLVSTCSARPEIAERVTAAPFNVITVPSNCPAGQEYINGQCREVWLKNFSRDNIGLPVYQEDAKNVISVPNNCPAGQEYVNGQCREVWRNPSVYPQGAEQNRNVVSVPPNCPPDQQVDANGECRKVWRSLPDDPQDASRNVISVPNQCPAGYRPDALGICREIFNN